MHCAKPCFLEMSILLIFSLYLAPPHNISVEKWGVEGKMCLRELGSITFGTCKSFIENIPLSLFLSFSFFSRDFVYLLIFCWLNCIDFLHYQFIWLLSLTLPPLPKKIYVNISGNTILTYNHLGLVCLNDFY